MTDEKTEHYRVTYKPVISIKVKRYPIIQQFNNGSLIYEPALGCEFQETTQSDSHEWFDSKKDALRAAYDEAGRAAKQLETELREVQAIKKRLAAEIGVNPV